MLINAFEKFAHRQCKVGATVRHTKCGYAQVVEANGLERTVTYFDADRLMQITERVPVQQLRDIDLERDLGEKLAPAGEYANLRLTTI